MAENEKLLEAARMIQEHCKHTEQGGLCPLAHNGICDGVNNCGIAGVGETIPGEDWEIPKPCRWTETDIALAKALQPFGFCTIIGKSGTSAIASSDKEAKSMPVGAFSNIKPGETVQLSDIIAEGAEQ